MKKRINFLWMKCSNINIKKKKRNEHNSHELFHKMILKEVKSIVKLEDSISSAFIILYLVLNYLGIYLPTYYLLII